MPAWPTPATRRSGPPAAATFCPSMPTTAWRPRCWPRRWRLERDPGVSIVYTDMQHFGVKTDHWRCGQATLAGQMQINFLAYCSLYRRGIWDAVGGYNSNIDAYADWDFWIGAFERGYRAAYIAEP